MNPAVEFQAEPLEWLWINGLLVSEMDAKVSVFDRGFLYGDGLFETMRVQSSRIHFWEKHWSRLNDGLRLLRIPPPIGEREILGCANELARKTKCSDGVLRLAISRGPGGLGYSPAGCDRPTWVLGFHPRKFSGHPSDPVRVFTSSFQVLAGDPLCAVKSASKLPYVLAKAEAEANGHAEALLLNHRGEIAETTSSNIFWLRGDSVFTPAQMAGALPGIARGAIIGLCRESGISVEEVLAPRAELQQADAIFLTNVIRGVITVNELDGRRIGESPIVRNLNALFHDLIGLPATNDAERQPD